MSSNEFVPKIIQYCKKTYSTVPDSPWIKHPENVVLRHKHSQKWYGLIMPVSKNKIGLSGDEIIWLLNLKADRVMISTLPKDAQNGIFPAYHMNHNTWISIVLDGTIDFDTICCFIDSSYIMTNK